jgi:hypothetical protein
LGLDMYLEARRYVSGYSHSSEQEQALFDSVTDAVGLKGVHDDRFATVSVNVAYWRKANQIHRWFVENVQDGKDDCGQYRVTRHMLLELGDVCTRVFKTGTVDVAEELLPLGAGSFFGSSHFDGYYFEEVEATAKRITELLHSISEEYDFYYQASW